MKEKEARSPLWDQFYAAVRRAATQGDAVLNNGKARAGTQPFITSSLQGASAEAASTASERIVTPDQLTNDERTREGSEER